MVFEDSMKQRKGASAAESYERKRFEKKGHFDDRSERQRRNPGDRMEKGL